MTAADATAHADPDADPDPEPRSRLRSLGGWIVPVVAGLVVFVLVRAFLVQLFWIPSPSMSPTLIEGDRVVIQKFADPQHPTRGDIIVFDKPPGVVDPEVEDLIKRVIALPGESVVIKDNHIFIDRRQLVEPYLPEGTITTNPPGWTQCTDQTPCVVPQGKVWVMGDNREHSQDSRSPSVGPIDETTIEGRAFALVWPPSRWSGL